MMQYGFGGAVPGHMLGYSPFGGLMIMGFILFAALIGFGLWALIRRDQAQATSSGAAVGSPGTLAPTQAPTYGTVAANDPLTIVRERLARGEIDVSQYTEIVAALQGQAPPTL